MAQLLIWGETREILAGALPAGVQVEEVKTLAAVEETLAGRLAGAMVVADPRCVEAEGEATAAWLRNGGSAQAFLVTVTDQAQRDEVLARLPFVEDVLERPVTPLRLLCKLEQALDVVRNRRVIRQLEEKLDRRGEELSELNKIGVALSAERDIPRLLELILRKSREITGADAGSLYLVQRAKEGDEANGDRLLFELAQNDSVDVPFKKQTMPLNETSIAGYVALTGRPVTVPDAYHPPDGAPYTFGRSFDEKSGYRSRSMLVVPMRDHENVVQGVVQLINKKRDRAAVLRSAALAEEEVIPFTSEDEKLASSLASQAAVAFENAQLLQRIRTLFDQFIHRAVAAVELRDPTTAGHSERVAILSVGLIEKVDADSTGRLAEMRFGRDQVEELRYAALLHDFGKVAVQEKYLRKGKKLYATQMIAIQQRFAYILKALEAEHLRRRLEAIQTGRSADLALIDAEYETRRAEVERARKAVKDANEPAVVEEDAFRAVMNLPTRVKFENYAAEERFPVESWAEGPFLTADEVEALSIRKGSLSVEERRKIESHVSHTYEFLRKLPWTGEFRRIPEIAWKHHEKLDGSGYPNRLLAHDIPAQSRMMTIADIFDALVAWDRPYKDSVPVERALEILDEEAKAGKLDKELLRVFLEAKLFDMPDYWDRPEMKGRRKSRA
ncbi:MAG TPA: HD domain-containing phosphohydrolase [Vicinamibacteria bacterium]|nr:HD domain-containing phosphohydrolase [Vicinamibacteria bacterium]